MKEGDEVKVSCRECTRQTNHKALSVVARRQSEEESGITWGEDYALVQCLGCESVSLLEETWCSEDWDPETNETPTKTNLYPSRDIEVKAGVDIYCLPKVVRKIYEDTIKTLNAKARVLAAVGIRAVVESICIDRKCQGGNLKEKIDDLVKQGVVSQMQAQYLHLHRFLGNAGAHEIQEPTAREIEAAFKITEGVLQVVYEFQETAGTLERYDKANAAATPTLGVALPSATN